MGSFAFYGFYNDDTHNVEETLFKLSTNPRHTIDIPNFEALIYIIQYFPHIITNITEDSILDRAESSGLSKALLIVQVGWFCANCAPQSPESGASQALRSPLKLPPEGVAVTVSISPGISISPDVTFNADGVTFGADGCQHLPSASRLPSASMLTAVCISCQHLVYHQHLPSASPISILPITSPSSARVSRKPPG